LNADPASELRAGALEALVRQAWGETLERSFDADWTWEECGADSLASLQLLLRLEKALERKLSFDLIQPDMTIADLVRSLETAPALRTADAVVPTVFIFPGLFGDEPDLAAFRRSFGQSLRFELVDHPDVGAPRAVLCDMVAAGKVAAHEVVSRQPEGPILLAGYSFGGCVAFEVATQLAACGRPVAFLAILDAALKASTRSSVDRLRRRLLVCAGRFDASRRLALALIARLLPAWSAPARRRLLAHFRSKAINAWRPVPMRVDALLAVSDQFGDTIVEPWSRLCPGIRVIRLPATHLSLFRPAALAKLMPAFEKAASAAHREGTRQRLEQPAMPLSGGHRVGSDAPTRSVRVAQPLPHRSTP
jgi:thioesterase domain-containing protein/acyl carrier protein